MNRRDIRLLQQIRGYPALTITLPTHRTTPDNSQDPIRLKNLTTEAVNRLLSEFTKREITAVATRLEELVRTIDFRYTLDGLALFVNADFGRAFSLPVTLKERVVVDETFATRDLVFAMNRSPRYWVLALSEKPTRLFEAMRDSLNEITEGGFPMTHEGPGGEAPLPGGRGVSKSAYRDDQHRQFFREVDATFKQFAVDDPLPLAVAGVDRYLSFFNEVSSHKDSIVTTLTGSHDKTPPHELGKLVWPLVSASLGERRRQALADLEKAVGERKYVSTIGEVWRLAREGRGRLLLVEEDYHCPARVDDSGMHIIPVDDPTEPGVIDDAVDEVIETVLNKQGKVVFVDNDSLKLHQRVALILRY